MPLHLRVGVCVLLGAGDEGESHNPPAMRFVHCTYDELQGLALEQVDRMLEETTPRTSARWVPSITFAEQIRMSNIETAKGGEATIIEKEV